MITVVNKHRVSEHIYCGRGSALGNPFSMKSEAERYEVCDKYEQYFLQKVEIEKNESMLSQLRIIYKAAKNGNVNLGCFCAPKRCHCDTIKTWIEKKLTEK